MLQGTFKSPPKPLGNVPKKRKESQAKSRNIAGYFVLQS